MFIVHDFQILFDFYAWVHYISYIIQVYTNLGQVRRYRIVFPAGDYSGARAVRAAELYGSAATFIPNRCDVLPAGTRDVPHIDASNARHLRGHSSIPLNFIVQFINNYNLLMQGYPTYSNRYA